MIGMSWAENEISLRLVAAEAENKRLRAALTEQHAQMMDEFAYADDYRFAHKLLVQMAESLRAGRHIDSYEEAARLIQERKAASPQEPRE